MVIRDPGPGAYRLIVIELLAQGEIVSCALF